VSKGGVVEEQPTPTTSDTEDVEAHGVVDRPLEEDRDAATESPDVEGHSFVERPPHEDRDASVERPPHE
jgi:hypothetical protein